MNEKTFSAWAVFATSIFILIALTVSPVSAYVYNNTNLTQYGEYPKITVPSNQLELTLVQGNGTLQFGYLPTVTRIEGFDTILTLEIVQTISLFVIMILTIIYVALYVDRYIGRR